GPALASARCAATNQPTPKIATSAATARLTTGLRRAGGGPGVFGPGVRTPGVPGVPGVLAGAFGHYPPDGPVLTCVPPSPHRSGRSTVCSPAATVMLRDQTTLPFDTCCTECAPTPRSIASPDTRAPSTISTSAPRRPRKLTRPATFCSSKFRVVTPAAPSVTSCRVGA